MNEIKRPWILAGYTLFAQEGPQGLKVEVLARQVGKSKSSFYHHFAELEIFTEELLQYHLERAKVIADQEKACQNVDPELFSVLLEHKEDLFFNRQLRFNRNIDQYRVCFEKASTEVSTAILGIWSAALGLDGKYQLADMVLGLTLENFYLQITPKTFTHEWLSNYLAGLKKMVRAFNK